MLIPIELQCESGHVQTFMVRKVVAIDGKPLEQVCAEQVPQWFSQFVDRLEALESLATENAAIIQSYLLQPPQVG